MKAVDEEKRGKGVKFSRIRRITGYITGDMSTWNSAKKAEEKDRVKHM
jgi:ribonucleoside-triphosphate reductase